MYSYPRTHRLIKADEFSSVFMFRKVRFGQHLKIHYKPNQFEFSRLGIIVSKKIHKRAVRRNYMKRVIRNLFRHAQPELVPHDVIVRVNKFFTHDDLPQIIAEFKQITHKLVTT